jgi:hypothetical protein
MMPRSRPWLPEQLLRLKELFNAGRPIVVIASELRRSRAAINNQVHKLGLARGPVPFSQVIVGRKHYSCLETIEEIDDFLTGA